MNAVLWWWRQPDHYDRLTSYLRARRMAAITRGIMAAASLLLASVPPAMVFSSAPPEGTARTVLAILCGLFGLIGSLLWLVTFPTRRQSFAYAVNASACIAVAVLVQSDPLFSLLTSTASVTISGYIALFHTATLMSLNVVAVVVLAAVESVDLAGARGVAFALCAGGMVLIVNLAIPLGVQLVVHAFGVDLVKADRDPLTGLLNRRAFYRRVTRLATTGPDGKHVVMAMVDLDRFKVLNDTRGHGVGDEALVAVAHALRNETREGAAIGRVGGEEFLIADIFDEPRPEDLGQRLCAAIHALPYVVTASVGTTAVCCDRIRGADDPRALLTALIGAADTAMYEAKRSGGNQFRYCCDPLDERPGYE